MSTAASTSASTHKPTVVIPFDGTAAAFGVWRTRIRAAFKVRGWEKYLTATGKSTPTAQGGASASSSASILSTTPTPDPAEQKQIDAAYGSLVESLPFDLIAAYTRDDPAWEHPAVLWQSIVAHFESTTMANRAHLRSKMASIRMTGTYLAFYTEIMATVHTLKSMGETVSDAEVIYLVLKGLPQAFEMIKTILQHDKALTIESMHRDLSARAEQHALEGEAPSSALASDGTYFNGRSSQGYDKARFEANTGANGPECWTCGQSGHRKLECPRNAGKVICTKCRTVGSHSTAECRRLRSSNNAGKHEKNEERANQARNDNRPRSGQFVKTTNADKPAASSSKTRRYHDGQHYFSSQADYDSEEESYFLGIETTSIADDNRSTGQNINPLSAYNYTHGISQEISTISKTELHTKTIELVMDSASSVNTCNDPTVLHDLKPVKPIRVKVGNGEVVTLDQAGSLRLSVETPNSKPIKIQDVYYAPKCPVNLLSVGALTKRKTNVEFKEKNAIVRRADEDNRIVMTVPAVENLFAIRLRVHPPDEPKHMHPSVAVQPTQHAVSEASKEAQKSYRLWHARLGHIGRTQMSKLARSQSISGLGQLQGFDFDTVGAQLCDGCELGKAHREKFNKFTHGQPAEEILDCLHADIKGPINVPTMLGERYLLLVTDERSRRPYGFLLGRKSDATEAIINLIKRLQVETGKTLREFHSDNGTEFVNKVLRTFLTDQGTLHSTTTPGTPQHNPIAERLNQTIFNMVRAMLFHAQLPPSFWGFAALSAVRVQCKTITSPNGGWTPKTIWRYESHRLNQQTRSKETTAIEDHKTSVKRMRVFGCNVYHHLQDQKATEPRSAKGIFLGYVDEARGYYRIMDLQSRKVIVRRDVHFDEDNFTFVREFTTEKYRPVEIPGGIPEEFNGPIPQNDNPAPHSARRELESEPQEESETESETEDRNQEHENSRKDDAAAIPADPPQAAASAHRHPSTENRTDRKQPSPRPSSMRCVRVTFSIPLESGSPRSSQQFWRQELPAASVLRRSTTIQSHSLHRRITSRPCRARTRHTGTEPQWGKSKRCS
jgi:hypothetical protein